MQLLAVTAVEAETEAVLRGRGRSVPAQLGPYRGRSAGDVTVVTAGVGVAAAAAATATALALGRFDAVASLGVGGGFDGRVDIGGLAVAEVFVAADLGAWSPDGFATVADLGFGECTICAGPLAREWAERLGAAYGPIVTVHAATGTDERAAELGARWSAVAEAMEGWGVAVAAAAYGVPAYEVRAVSNRCGLRDRAAWDLTGALAALAEASAMLVP